MTLLYDGLKRTPGWRARLSQALVLDAGKTFEWGNADCFMGLVVPAVQALTETDIGGPFRDRYANALSAADVLKQDGFNDLADAASKYFPEIPVALAHIGDIVSVPSGLSNEAGLGISLGIVNGERAIVLTPKGFGSVALRRAVRAFRVG